MWRHYDGDAIRRELRELADGWQIKEVLYGSAERLAKGEITVLSLSKS